MASSPGVLLRSAIGLALLVEAGFHALIPLGARYLIDGVIPARNVTALYFAIEVLGAAAVTAIIAGFLRDLLSTRAQAQSLRRLRLRVFEQMQHVSLQSQGPLTHAFSRASEVVERLATDFAAVENAAAVAISWGALPLIEALLGTALILWINWHAGVVAGLLWPWVLLAPRTVSNRIARAAAVRDEAETGVFAAIRESLSSQAVVRAFSLEHFGLAAFRKPNDLLSSRTRRASRVSAFMERLTGTGILAIQTLLLALSGWLSFNGSMTFGSLAAVQMLALIVSHSLLFLTEYLPGRSEAKAARRRIEYAMYPRAVSDRPDARLLPPVQTEIVLAHVGFRFASQAEGQPDVLSDIKARIPSGTHVAFVGPAGSGKSTLLHLLMRFYDPTAGFITIDGHDLKSITQASLRSRVGIVLQENSIFSTSILENIRLGKPDASEELVIETAKAVGLDEFFSNLSTGYETLLGENGLKLSSAAIQRVAVARAILRDPEILLLDEVTSALDPADELAVHAMLRDVAKGRTVVSASHRLSTVADADHIFVLDGGQIVEQGSHFELMAAEGVYAGLWRKQAGFNFSADGSHVDVDVRRLTSFPILENLDEEKLAEIAPLFATETFPAGREIVRQNDPGDRFYIIARGVVEVWRTEEISGNTQRVAVLQDGDFFGEITLITGFPRTATVRAATVCTCVSLGRGQFNRMMDRFPELRRQLSEIAVQRLRESSKAMAAGALI